MSVVLNISNEIILAVARNQMWFSLHWIITSLGGVNVKLLTLPSKFSSPLSLNPTMSK